MNTYRYLLLLMICFVSCKTVSVQQELQQITVNSKILGSVGEQKDFVLEQSYNNIAFPNYQNPIKIDVTSVSFTKATFKMFLKAKEGQKSNVSVNYIDSLKVKPHFLKLKLADKVEIISALNSKYNKDIKDYLFNKNESHIVSGISLALNQNEMNTIINSDEVFLEHTGIKSYAINCYKNSELLQTLLFNQGVVFTYKTSSFCWQEDDKYQLKIVDITETNKCPKSTSSSAKQAKKNINYFKF